MPPHKKQWAVKPEQMPANFPAGADFLQEIQWPVWELQELQASVQEMGDYMAEQMANIRVHAVQNWSLNLNFSSGSNPCKLSISGI